MVNLVHKAHLFSPLRVGYTDVLLKMMGKNVTQKVYSSQKEVIYDHSCISYPEWIRERISNSSTPAWCKSSFLSTKYTCINSLLDKVFS